MNKKKFPVLMVVLGVVGTIMLVLGLAVFITVGLHHSFVSQYKKNVYAADKEQKLLVMNVPESYLPYYNLGNVSYKNGDYNGAFRLFVQKVGEYSRIAAEDRPVDIYEEIPQEEHPYSCEIVLPPLAAVFFRVRKTGGDAPAE